MRHLICFLLESGGDSAWIDPRRDYEQTLVSDSQRIVQVAAEALDESTAEC